MRMVVKKTSTGLVGLAVDVNARANFIGIQKEILEKIKVCCGQFPRLPTPCGIGETVFALIWSGARLGPLSCVISSFGGEILQIGGSIA